ncbi:MAG: PAS domain-containing protein [Sedimentisphaerales bacterium]|nr:PAS domain-containing protein [Sedimentisphaerales bacterium]
MKSANNLYVIAIVIAACVLLTAGFAAGSYSGRGEGLYAPAAIACCFAAAGTVWFGWNWLRLVRNIKSTTQQLREKQTSRIKPNNSKIINELSEAINKHFGGNSSYIEELENQVKELQLKLQLLRKQKRNTDEIIYGIRDAVIVIDEFDKLLIANEAASKLFGFDHISSRHKPVSELISREKAGNNEFVSFLCQSRQSKSRHIRREINITNETETKTFDCIVSCIYDEAGRITGMVAVLHDVTREKEISQMKNDFVSRVSHELKTPLASISAYSEMLADGEANDEKTRKEFYSVIQDQAKRLNRLIEDILNISRIESGLIKVDKKPVSLTILIEEQLQMIRNYAEEKNITVIGQKPIVFDQVYADKDMISEVVINLLSNAVKYTPRGGSIKIEMEVDENAGKARVRITDTGIGIPENEIEHIFDKFYRIGANKKQAEGTGLGLNLVKQIVEKVHNGRVFVKSKPGEGSTFGFELPLAAAETVKA